MNWRIHRFETVDSTMHLAAEMPVGSVVVADEQRAGVGRHGHEWESPADAGLYVSIVLPAHPLLTLALGLAARGAIARVTSLDCDIRWPNDLMLSEKKFGGILVQAQQNDAVAGIGINVNNRRFAPELAAIATSLALETNLEFRRDDLLDGLLEQIPIALSLPSAELISAWERVSSWARHKSVAVDLGDRVLRGITAGLDPRGFLRVRRLDGSFETVIAGGVRAG